MVWCSQWRCSKTYQTSLTSAILPVCCSNESSTQTGSCRQVLCRIASSWTRWGTMSVDPSVAWKSTSWWTRPSSCPWAAGQKLQCHVCCIGWDRSGQPHNSLRNRHKRHFRAVPPCHRSSMRTDIFPPGEPVYIIYDNARPHVRAQLPDGICIRESTWNCFPPTAHFWIQLKWRIVLSRLLWSGI